MKNLNEKVIKAIEDLGWIVTEYDEEYMIEQSSPAGEDIVEYIKKGEDVVSQVWDIYNSFDEDEHVDMWLQAKSNGTAGVPSARELVKDAEEIRQMYHLLALAVVAAVEEANKKKIEFVAGYHEWQVIVDGNPIYAFDDFSEDIKENMTAEQVEALVDDLIYSWQMSFENDCDSIDEDEECPVTPIWETHGTELRKAMKEAICKHYGISLSHYEVNTVLNTDGEIDTSNTFATYETARAFYDKIGNDQMKELLKVDENGITIEEIECNYGH